MLSSRFGIEVEFTGITRNTAAKVAAKYFNGKIECAVDGGVCDLGIESTIVDLTVKPFRILRAGGLTPEEIKGALK